MSAPARPIVVVARWSVPASARATVLALLPELQRHSLQEPGCLGYEVLHAPQAPECIVLIERYRDSAAIEAHRSSTHYRSLVVERIVPLLSSRQVDLLETLD